MLPLEDKDTLTLFFAGESMEFVHVPAGEFIMGRPAGDRFTQRPEHPDHTVFLSDFWIGKYPVTFGQFRAYMADLKALPADFPTDRDKFPIHMVTWYSAKSFCSWLQNKAGHEMGDCVVRLPTEAEWEKAARGTDCRSFPWGNGNPTIDICNYNYSQINTTTPVGEYSPQGDSPYGCADMAGNVLEWTCSPWNLYLCQVDGDVREDEDDKDDEGDEDAEGCRILRGGSFIDAPGFLRCTYRFSALPDTIYDNFGFRVCAGPILI